MYHCVQGWRLYSGDQWLLGDREECASGSEDVVGGEVGGGGQDPGHASTGDCGPAIL